MTTPATFPQGFCMTPKALPPLDTMDPVRAWQPWQPEPPDRWNLKWAGHLYRRAAFGASLDEIRQAERRGLPATLDLLLQGEPRAQTLHSFLMNEGAKIARRNNEFELRGWWLYCMVNSGYPLRE